MTALRAIIAADMFFPEVSLLIGNMHSPQDTQTVALSLIIRAPFKQPSKKNKKLGMRWNKTATDAL